MRRRDFRQVDVFSADRYRGNPVAVVLDADGIDDAEMAGFARWTNLSETTFVLPPNDPRADYRLRIFTPVRELPFAGHPTLGSCHAWLERRGRSDRSGRPEGRGSAAESSEQRARTSDVERRGESVERAGRRARPSDAERRGRSDGADDANEVIQECGAGLVRLRRDGDRLAFAAPELVRSGSVDAETQAAVVRALGVDRAKVEAFQWADNGPGWVAVLLDSAETVLALEPDRAAFDGLRIGVVGPYPGGSECAYEVRAFVPALGVGEDPVTGSLNAGIAQWLIGEGRAPERYVAGQGTALRRAGRVHVQRIGDDVWIGGASTTCVDGTVLL